MNSSTTSPRTTPRQTTSGDGYLMVTADEEKQPMHKFDGIEIDMSGTSEHLLNNVTGTTETWSKYKRSLAFLFVSFIASTIEGNFTAWTTREAFSEEANAGPALADRLHPYTNNTPLCDQTGNGEHCPEWLSPLANKAPDKVWLVMTLILFVLTLYSAMRLRDPTVFIYLVAEFLLIDSLLMFMRSTTVYSTTMPSPSPICRGATWGTRPKEGWFIAEVDCNDSMFSGHTVTYTIGLVFVQCSFLHPVIKVLWIIVYLLAAIVSAVVADHYTSDVLVALYLSYAVAMHRRHALKRYFGKGAYILGLEFRE